MWVVAQYIMAILVSFCFPGTVWRAKRFSSFLCAALEASKGLLQFDLWHKTPQSGRWDWQGLKATVWGGEEGLGWCFFIGWFGSFGVLLLGTLVFRCF